MVMRKDPQQHRTSNRVCFDPLGPQDADEEQILEGASSHVPQMTQQGRPLPILVTSDSTPPGGNNSHKFYIPQDESYDNEEILIKQSTTKETFLSSDLFSESSPEISRPPSANGLVSARPFSFTEINDRFALPQKIVTHSGFGRLESNPPSFDIRATQSTVAIPGPPIAPSHGIVSPQEPSASEAYKLVRAHTIKQTPSGLNRRTGSTPDIRSSAANATLLQQNKGGVLGHRYGNQALSNEFSQPTAREKWYKGSKSATSSTTSIQAMLAPTGSRSETSSPVNGMSASHRATCSGPGDISPFGFAKRQSGGIVKAAQSAAHKVKMGWIHPKETEITFNVADILTRQRFILKAC
ncbi:hypothetical protein NEOLI_003633 [Neolecta irregularis DAH-3]|uniref:Uncharacterized protein n=1 Tax=Neolecta irregularis (strain DAH-3) TaxID=1198029 RepID=A0A1U7LI07_NEOID|nr:hypothetical protein NEOLI_003633 [Neolecta irregularis DAH-3]|eukprot:OLL22279.1 hypothetical protein NEOLI_003633 [Neolecta irregularis DAH-3]